MSSIGGRSWPRVAAEEIGEALLRRGEEPPRLRIRLGRDHVAADHRVGPLQLLGGLEALAIDFERGPQRVGREMRSEGEGQAERRGQLRAEQAGAENP